MMLLMAAPSVAQGVKASRRFALLVGNNEGGEGTQPLQYSVDDARRMHEVLTRLGGVDGADAMLLTNENEKDVSIALDELERRSKDARAQGQKTSLFFYFSGHAKDGSLRLGDSRLSMESLKQRLTAAPADTRVVIFDACRSGSVTRSKGVRRAPVFEVENDLTRATRGLVILTSSASGEDSQESDLIGASYFSYHLTTALLGSADANSDGRVSLHEAYAYAYERTVASTADSAAGAQHPTFSFDLAGNGDLQLTDVIQRNEGVRLPSAAPEGVYFFVDTRGVVVAEITKEKLERVVALSPGRYRVKRRLADRLRVGALEIREGQFETLDESQLKDTKFSDDPVKGTGLSSVYARHWGLSASGQYQAIFDAPTTAGGYFPSAPLIGGELSLHNVLTRGLQLSFDASYGWASGNVSTMLLPTLAYRYSLVTLGGSALYEFRQQTNWVPFAGLRVGLNLMSREFSEPALPKQTYTTMSPGLVAGLKYRISTNFSVMARGRLHYLLYNIDETRNLGYAEAGLLLQYEFREQP